MTYILFAFTGNKQELLEKLEQAIECEKHYKLCLDCKINNKHDKNNKNNNQKNNVLF